MKIQCQSEHFKMVITSAFFTQCKALCDLYSYFRVLKYGLYNFTTNEDLYIFDKRNIKEFFLTLISMDVMLAYDNLIYISLSNAIKSVIFYYAKNLTITEHNFIIYFIHTVSGVHVTTG